MMTAAMFDPILLRSFLAVAQARNFTEDPHCDFVLNGAHVLNF